MKLDDLGEGSFAPGGGKSAFRCRGISRPAPRAAQVGALSAGPVARTLTAVKRLLTRKWVLTHVFVVALVALFLLLGWWQLQRAETGNSRSWAYSMEWPSFALLVIGFWIKIMHDELHPRTESDDAPNASPRRGRRGRRRADADSGRIAEDPELAAYNRYIADLAERRERH